MTLWRFERNIEHRGNIEGKKFKFLKFFTLKRIRLKGFSMYCPPPYLRENFKKCDILLFIRPAPAPPPSLNFVALAPPTPTTTEHNVHLALSTQSYKTREARIWLGSGTKWECQCCDWRPWPSSSGEDASRSYSQARRFPGLTKEQGLIGQQHLLTRCAHRGRLMAARSSPRGIRTVGLGPCKC